MSLTHRVLAAFASAYRKHVSDQMLYPATSRSFFVAAHRYQCDSLPEQEDASQESETEPQPGNPKEKMIVDPETSIRYLDSKAYNSTYADEPVWTHYRRNFKGSLPKDTRKTCVRSNIITTGSPCPICRDEYLVFNYKNVKLLEQFISPQTGEILPTMKTGLCQKQHKKLRVEIYKARDYGYIETVVPFREYNYSQYMQMTIAPDPPKTDHS